MTHINDLPVIVLGQILYQAAATPAKNLSEWKAKLLLLAVCRTWTTLAIGTVFSQVYIEPLRSPDSISSAHFLWTSNAELLISRECVSMARRLTLEWSYCATSDHLHYIVVEILKLDRVDWQDINSLTITLADWTIYRTQYQHLHNDRVTTDNADIVQYFAQNLRNVVELNLHYRRYGATEKYLFDGLATHYDQQFQVLRAPGQIPMPISCIARNINVLELTLDLSAACILPSICGGTLRVLRLDNVPRNFAWHYFRYDIFVRPVVFRQLAILRLTFKYEDTQLTEGEIQDKIDSGAHCCEQLGFPALKELSISNCTPDCDLLYANLPFPGLDRVNFSGDVSDIRHCSRLKLTWVRELHVAIISADLGDTTDFYRVTNHFFSDICIGQTAALHIFCDWFMLDPELMRWVNLTTLQFHSVNYSKVCRAIGRLPNLCELIIRYLEFGNKASDSSAVDSSLFFNADPMVSWGAKLATVEINALDRKYPVSVCVDSIQAFILHAGALKALTVPESAEELVDAFIEIHTDRYSHLADIDLISSDF
ncbi:hypothetical protein GGI17_004226 [Coemansia sp. S146]|nr:hypothetical protein GGI17_004226 [Coemansia sp. S146]